MSASRVAIRRGVNAFDTSRRYRVWSGGSMKIMISWGAGSGLSISSTVPWDEQKVLGSRLNASTSAKRLTA